MKYFAIVAAVCAMTTSALAGSCQDDLAAVDRAIATVQTDADTKAQVEDMRNQAVQLCGAGNEQEGVDVLLEAKSLLNVE